MTPAELLPLFREYFPEFNKKTDDAVLLTVNTALVIHAICELATIYLAAHIFTVDSESGVGGSGGGVDAGGVREKTNDSAKNISASFVSLASKEGDAFYTNTPYGRMYITLRDACPGRRFSVRIA